MSTHVTQKFLDSTWVHLEGGASGLDRVDDQHLRASELGSAIKVKAKRPERYFIF
jgi:hypothetical protein